MTVAEQPKGFHEAFAKFFEKPTRQGLRQMLKENHGEFNHLDFKEAWIEESKLAKHILGFANSHGGVIIVGVMEAADGSLSSVGLSTLADKTDKHNSVKKYLPNEAGLFEIIDFQFKDTEYSTIQGKMFQVLIVNDQQEHIPFVCESSGKDIREGAIYVRDGVATVEGSQKQIQQILNRRIATGHSTSRELTLREHLDELRMLYGEIRERVHIPPASSLEFKNPFYPQEGYEVFVSRCIESKKKLVESFLLQLKMP
jgi:predicted HTH transcriptional regulator